MLYVSLSTTSVKTGSSVIGDCGLIAVGASRGGGECAGSDCGGVTAAVADD